METFVIGDIHRHLDRYEALLIAAGLLTPDYGSWESRRLQRDAVNVVCLGDIIHAGNGSTTIQDDACAEAVFATADTVLWGNHDRAIIDPVHHFSGYHNPDPVTVHRFRTAAAVGQLQLATTAHGRLLTHAGLARQWLQTIPHDIRTDVDAVARWINHLDIQWLPPQQPETTVERWECLARDAVGTARGGAYEVGGILWRDWDEPIADCFPQICGHTKDSHVRRYPDSAHPTEHTHYCLDIGDADNGRLCGLWIERDEFVTVDLS